MGKWAATILRASASRIIFPLRVVLIDLSRCRRDFGTSNVRRTLHIEAQWWGGRRTGIRLVTRTMAGAHINETAAPMKILRALLNRRDGDQKPAASNPLVTARLAPPAICRRMATSHFVDTTLPRAAGW
jgi:hypothetical protein